MTGKPLNIRMSENDCSHSVCVGLKRGRPDEGLEEGVPLTLLFPSSWQFEQNRGSCVDMKTMNVLDVFKLFSSTHREVENEL